MAIVYKAEQENPKRLIALKMPRGGRLLSKDSRQRFLREAQLLAKVHNSAVVPILDMGETDGLPYYTMPFIEGRTLKEIIADERLPLGRRLDLFKALCRVVASLHEQNLVHRDLKPDNVMVDLSGDIRLLDFGLAKALESHDQKVTLDGQILGTLQYMAPEQTIGGAPITPATDVYALGMILFQLLTRKLPYSVEGHQVAALDRIRTERMISVTAFNAAVPTYLDRITSACLRKDPALRPADAGVLLGALESASWRDWQPLRTQRAVAWALILAGGALVLLALWAATHGGAPPF